MLTLKFHHVKVLSFGMNVMGKILESPANNISEYASGMLPYNKIVVYLCVSVT